MDDLVSARRRFAEEIRAVAHLESVALVEAFARVPREHFLGPGPWQIAAWMPPGRVEYRSTVDANPSQLYRDVLVAIDLGRLLNNGQPSGLAQWIGALGLKTGETAVHVGCGTGYYSAIMAEVVGSAGRVIAVDIDSALAKRARTNLAYLPQVNVLDGDGGPLNTGPVDAIFVNAGATHPHRRWLDALGPGGRLLLPITAERRL
jgi:protein-L-isoaspartate(D-aspartate) O-methyltransferase